MDIHTKYSVGDIIYTRQGAQEIGSIIISRDCVMYRILDSWRTYSEDECFPTKTELDQYLDRLYG